MMTTDISKFGINLTIPRIERETDEMFSDRLWWILRQDLRGKTAEEINQMIRLSRIYIHRKYLNCRYSTEVENMVDRMTVG